MKTFIRFAALLALLVSLPAPAAPGKGAHSQMPSMEEEEDLPSGEPFSDGAQALQIAKAKLLAEYYRADLTEDDLYRAAVQGMLSRIDPSSRATTTCCPRRPTRI